MNPIAPQKQRLFTWTLHLAGAAVVALVLGLFYLAVFQPLEGKLAAHTLRAGQLDALLNLTDNESRQFRQLRDELSQLESSVALVHQQLANQAHDPAWVESLRALSARVDLEVTDYQIRVTEVLPTHSQTEVEFHCLGSYGSICRFLDQAENLAKTTKLTRFQLSPASGLDQYSIQLTFVLYSDASNHDTKEKRADL